LIQDYLDGGELDVEHSVVIGDRDCDMQLAKRAGLRGIRIGNGLGWQGAVRGILSRQRTAAVRRQTKETRIDVFVNLDEPGSASVETGIGFFDHMLEQLSLHGDFSLQLRCSGDLHIDEHHTVEDCALALGEALREALGDRAGIGRYGFLLPMDESRAQVALDLSGRPWCTFEADFGREQVGGLPTEMVSHFFRSLSQALGATIHIEVLGDNTHHMIEAAFKGLGRALRPALRIEGGDIPSTKGQL
jgi:imidazoleglycerol-phosphate dehydratase/histidinol-phosphatase